MAQQQILPDDAIVEQYLSIDLLDGLAFCDSSVQRMWYDRFCSLKASIPAEVTVEDVAAYGKLLLPGLCASSKT